MSRYLCGTACREIPQCFKALGFAQGATESMNMTRTSTDGDAKLTRGRSGPVRYEVVDKDEDRTGKGWDVQVEGCE